MLGRYSLPFFSYHLPMLKAFRFNNTIATLISLGIISSLLPSFLLSNKIELSNVSETLTQLFALNTDTNQNTPEELDNFGKILGLTALGVGATSLAWHLNKNKAQSLSLPKQDSLSIDSVSPKLRKKLLKLVYNNRQTANRLLIGASFSHQGRSIDWLADKVIYDLERDRGLY